VLVTVVEALIFAGAGLFGGFVRAIVTGEGLLVLPKVRRGRVDLGFLSSVIVGTFAGLIAPYGLGVNAVVAALAGYAGTDALENLAERITRHRGSIT